MAHITLFDVASTVIIPAFPERTGVILLICETCRISTANRISQTRVILPTRSVTAADRVICTGAAGSSRIIVARIVFRQILAMPVIRMGATEALAASCRRIIETRISRRKSVAAVICRTRTAK